MPFQLLQNIRKWFQWKSNWLTSKTKTGWPNTKTGISRCQKTPTGGYSPLQTQKDTHTFWKDLNQTFLNTVQVQSHSTSQRKIDRNGYSVIILLRYKHTHTETLVGLAGCHLWAFEIKIKSTTVFLTPAQQVYGKVDCGSFFSCLFEGEKTLRSVPSIGRFRYHIHLLIVAPQAIIDSEKSVSLYLVTV